MDVPEKAGQHEEFTTIGQGGFIDTGANVLRRQAEPAAEVEAIAKAIATPPTTKNIRQVTSLPPPTIPHSNPDWVGAIHVGGDPYSWIGKKIEVLWTSNQKWYGQSRSVPNHPSIPVRGVHSAVPAPAA